MFGLTMIKGYLNEILDGSKTFDARSYPTNKRGVIALKPLIDAIKDLQSMHIEALELIFKNHMNGGDGKPIC